MWLIKTVIGALTSGQFRMYSPARLLEAKPFSFEYWKWQHRFFSILSLSSVGHQSFSPYRHEWSFPVTVWLSSLRDLTRKGSTELAAFETIHITHILDQVIRATCVAQMTKDGRITFSNLLPLIYISGQGYSSCSPFSGVKRYYTNSFKGALYLNLGIANW